MATPYPASVHHSSRSVDPDEALKLLQAYITASETKAWLHPDAILSERGPRIAGTMEGGLTMHNLRRVEAGLRGERLGVEGAYPFDQHGWDSAVRDGMYEPMDMAETDNKTVFPSVHDVPGGSRDKQAVPSTVALAAVEDTVKTLQPSTISPDALDDHAREENRSSETALQPQIPAALSKEARKKAKAERKEARRLRKEKR
ncbi:MAG: hypothetical protein M1815_001576 [Lichina confinis]|nr:MAG: hypothetical protein M1815_001576 [Lichina confinis]